MITKSVFLKLESKDWVNDMNENNWGGKREGAGRKKDDTVKVRWNVTVTPEEKEYLQHMLFMYRAKNVQK